MERSNKYIHNKKVTKHKRNRQKNIEDLISLIHLSVVWRTMGPPARCVMVGSFTTKILTQGTDITAFGQSNLKGWVSEVHHFYNQCFIQIKTWWFIERITIFVNSPLNSRVTDDRPWSSLIVLIGIKSTFLPLIFVAHAEGGGRKVGENKLLSGKKTRQVERH